MLPPLPKAMTAAELRLLYDLLWGPLPPVLPAEAAAEGAAAGAVACDTPAPARKVAG